MQIKMIWHIRGKITIGNNYYFQFLISPLIYGVETQKLCVLSSYSNVFKYAVKYPMH